MRNKKNNVFLLTLIFLTVFISSVNSVLVWGEYSNDFCSLAQSYVDPDEVVTSWIGHWNDRDWFKGYLSKDNILSTGLEFSNTVYYWCWDPPNNNICSKKIDYDVLIRPAGCTAGITKICQNVGSEFEDKELYFQSAGRS